MINRNDKEPRKLTKWTVRYLIYGAVAVVCIIWSIIGMRFVTDDSDGMTCFFLATLPVVGFFVMLTFLLVTRIKQQREKRRSEKEGKKMSQCYYYNYLVEYGAESPQFKTALKEADVETLERATKACTQTNLKRINAELRRRAKNVNN